MSIGKKIFPSFLSNSFPGNEDFHRLAIIAFVLMVLLYMPTFSTSPVLDDFFHFFLFDSTPVSLLPDLLSPRFGFVFIRPVYYLEFWFERALFSSWMPAYRIVAIVLHIFIGILLAKISTCGEKRSRLSGRFLFFLWVFNPVSYRIILYPSCRTDILFWLFSLISLRCYIAFECGKKKLIPGFFTIFFYSAALLSKETAIVLPILIMITSQRFSGSWRTKGTRKIVRYRSNNILPALLFSSTVAYLLFRFYVFHGIGGYQNALFKLYDPHVLQRLLYLLFVLIPGQVFFPFAAPDKYPHIQSTVVYCASAAYFLLSIYLFKKLRNERPVVLFCLLEMWLTALPVIPVILNSGLNYIVPRYLYAPSWAVVWLLALAVCHAPEGKKRWTWITMIVLIWAPISAYNHTTFAEAGRITETVIEDLTHYCDVLDKGGTLIVVGIPQHVGAINVEHYHEIFTVFNLETHRRCGLIRDYPVEKGISLSVASAYMEELPGRVSTYPLESLSSIVGKPLKPGDVILRYRPATGHLEPL